jgi:hypothetical protein
MEYKFGIENEYATLRSNGEFMDFTNTNYKEVQSVIDSLPDKKDPYLHRGSLGIKVKNWYIEGDDRFDNEGELIDVAYKGVEIRTSAHNSIDAAFEELQSLQSTLQNSLQEKEISLTSIGFNPYTASYAPNYSKWEKNYHSIHTDYANASIWNLSYGPDLNFSSSDWNDNDVISIAERLTYYSPYIVSFSFSSPFYTNSVWEGPSYRTFVRTGIRPAATAYLQTNSDHPLVKTPRPLTQTGRIEFKAFDAVRSPVLLRELSYLILGIALANKDLPGKSEWPDKKMHEHVAMRGFGDTRIVEGAEEVLTAAKKALGENEIIASFPLLNAMLQNQITPADDILKQYERTNRVVQPLQNTD